MKLKLMFSPEIFACHWVSNDFDGFGRLTTVRVWPFFLIWWHGVRP